MNKFLSSIAGVLEVDSLSIDQAFREVDGWCSLHAFGILVTLENDYSTRLTIDKFLTLKTVKDLYREAFLTFAAEILQVPRETLSGESEMGLVPTWDSVAQLRLVMEAEPKFGTHYPLELIPELKKIDDFLI